MLPLAHRIAFALFALLCIMLSARGFYRLYLRIARGREDADSRTARPLRRAWYALRATLTQERVFRKRPVLSVFHSFIFYAFVLYLLVNLIDAVDGYLTINIWMPQVVRNVYGFSSDALSVLALIAVLAFTLRRFVLPSKRDFQFNEKTLVSPRVLRGYVQRDSLIVSGFIVFHIGCRIIGNAAKLAATEPDAAQPFSSFFAHAFAGHDPLAWRISGYWGALGSVLLFLVYFPYSKHVHLIMAPVKYFFRRENSSGELPAMKIDLDAAEPQLGAATLAELSWPRLLDGYACIQCNRCQDVCPASQTGKALSPAALEINKRMALNAIAEEASVFSLRAKSSFEAGTSGGPQLLQAVISPEAVWACTTCGACMEVCPTQDEQMLDIIDIRRNAVMQQGEFPAQLASAFRGMERAGNPWGIARDKRMDWAESLHVPTVDEVPEPDVLYWVGCAASYDPAAGKTARALVQLLTEADVNFAVLGKRESCTGDSARRAGNELLYQQLATESVATLNQVRPKQVIASCPHCVNTISTEYPQFGGHFDVVHHTEYLESMLRDGKLAPLPTKAATTFHDPCYLGRHRGSYDQPRSVLQVLTNDYRELPRTKSNAFCCGAGGAQFWKEEEQGSERISENRFHEVQQTLQASEGEKVLAVGCPFCKSMLQSTPSAAANGVVIKDVAELLWEGVQRAKGTSVSPVQAEPALLQSKDAPAEDVQVRAGEVTSAATPLAATPSPVTASNGSSADDLPGKELAPTLAQAASPPTERKKWQPKVKIAVPSSEPERAATQEIEKTPSEEPQGNSTPARKKWQPKQKS